MLLPHAIKSIIVSCAAMLLISPTCLQSEQPAIDREEARQAYLYLNKIRRSPKKYARQLKFSPVQVKPRAELHWNDTLAAVAERKAMDMANKDYFEHVDPKRYGINHYIAESGYELDVHWVKDRRANFFESLHAGHPTGELAIQDLIIDRGVSGKGHRKHLLGVGDWNSSLVDIGIGFVQSNDKTEYPSYVCVIIAKHP